MANSILDSHMPTSPTNNTILVSHGWPNNTSGNALLVSHGDPYVQGADTYPDAFYFADIAGTVAVSTNTQSVETITVAGITAAAAITISGSGGSLHQYSKNGTAYKSTADTVVAGDTVRIQHTSSGSNSTAATTTLTIGGRSDTFTSTTVAGSGALLFDDGFETGDLSHTKVTGATTASWITGDSVNVSAQTTQPHTGTYSCRARFAGSEPGLGDASDATAELRFDLGTLCTEVWLAYDLYIPAGFVYRDSTNNKFFRLWGATYGDQEKVGASWWGPTSGSNLCRINADWNTGPGMGEHGTDYASAITTSDLGAWMAVKIQVVAATAVADGTLKIWKNGTLIIDNTGTMDNYTSGEPHAYRYGYLLGWANSGFLAQTDLYIDNVKMGTTEASVA